jgi:hypothetical protein
VQSTQTAPPPAGGRQERELIIGRYRLVSFHRGDESTEVWRALDEMTKQVVTLEFLRERDPARRERFVAEGRRMASIENPSVMRVALVHDDAALTFMVFEHLVHVPVNLDLLKPPDDPAAPRVQLLQPAAVAPPAPILRPAIIDDPRPAVAAEPVPPPVASPVLPAVTSEDHYDHGVPALMAALRARELALIDATILKEAAVEIWAAIRQAFEDLHLEDVRFDGVVSGARELLGRIDLSVLTSARARLSGLPRPALPRARAATANVAVPKVPAAPRVKAEKVKAEKIKPAPKVKAPREPKAPGRPLLRVRWGRVLTRGLAVGVLAAAVAVVPADVLARFGNQVLSTASDLGNQVGPAVTNVANQVGPAVTNVANQVGAAVSERLAPPAPGLAKPSFEVPPLAAYGAAFETQGAYPKATAPNGTVEWVVALRNTGSAGWYRGIEGAQASLALADGTSAGVQTTAYVGPGQVGWFVVHFQAPAQPGTYTVALLPRVDGRGALPDLGIYAQVTVATNP